ncbi:hypothetical protein CW354_05200 [Marinicaulis flavus]|uniref:Uncharacterized protein n=1 Tax=Hyphococcus luteus TaxID=2058213 RepID=A0A2S7K5J8_9PROT|nr:hypothetical protein CW354_05200 [Marinicaulis flavus]
MAAIATRGAFVAGFWEKIVRFLPAPGGARANVSLTTNVATGAAKLVRGPQKTPGPLDYAKRGLKALSFKWIAISVALTGLFLFLASFSATDTDAYETALQSQARNGDWVGGLRSLFVLRMLATPRPLEFLVMITLTPVVWHMLPKGWRFLVYPMIAQMIYMLISQIAVMPLEFALLNLFTSVTDALRALAL